MKLKNFMAVALISTALTGASFAAHNLATQDTDTVKNIADMGYTSNKKLTFSREAVDSVLHADFDAARGSNDNTKRAKAYLKGTVDATVNLFAGADLPTKKNAFLAALDQAIVDKGGPIEVNIDTIGFNVAKVATPQQISDSAKLFFAEINPIDPREALLKQAKVLSITNNTDGTPIDTMLTELSTAANKETVLSRVDVGALDAKIQARLAKHEVGGKYENMGLTGNKNKIGEFHNILQAKSKKGGGPADPKFTKFFDDVKGLFDDGVLEGDGTDENTILASLQNLGTQITTLQGELAKVAGGEKGQKFKVVQGTSGQAHIIKQEHDLGTSGHKGGMNF